MAIADRTSHPTNWFTTIGALVRRFSELQLVPPVQLFRGLFIRLCVTADTLSGRS